MHIKAIALKIKFLPKHQKTALFRPAILFFCLAALLAALKRGTMHKKRVAHFSQFVKKRFGKDESFGRQGSNYLIGRNEQGVAGKLPDAHIEC